MLIYQALKIACDVCLTFLLNEGLNKMILRCLFLRAFSGTCLLHVI